MPRAFLSRTSVLATPQDMRGRTRRRFTSTRAGLPRHAAIDDIHRTLGSTLREDAPLFALRLAPGLGFAEDPGTGDSFGMARSRLLAEALWVAFARSAKSAARVMEEIEAYFLQNGIELDRAHLNPWSVDRFEMRLLG